MVNGPVPGDLHIAGIHKSFGSVHVLDGVSVDIPDGQFTTLLGPSGCGKTTLLRIIAGFEAPDAGSVRLGSTDLLPLPANRRPVNTVFQSYALFPHLSVRDNVAFGLRARGLPEDQVRTRIAAMLASVRIEALADRRPHELSGGQRQRVALARALVNQPEILLLDEPMSALDAKLRHDVQLELKRIQRECGITFVLVTHDQDEAIAVSDRILIMNQGRIEQDGTPEEVYERPISRFVATFMGSANVLEATRTANDRVSTIVGDLTVASRPAWERGSIAIRPEDVELRTDGTGENRLPGRVADRFFRGDHWEVLVEVHGHQLRVTTEPDHYHAVDERLFVELPKDDLLVLRD